MPLLPHSSSRMHQRGRNGNRRGRRDGDSGGLGSRAMGWYVLQKYPNDPALLRDNVHRLSRLRMRGCVGLCAASI